MHVGMTKCIVQRVSYTGDLGYEIYCDPICQRTLFQTLWTAGLEFGMRPFGMRAMMSLRLDKFFGSWQREFSPDYTAVETGLDRFISFKKNVNFVGRAAAEQERRDGTARRLCIFEVDAGDSDVVAYEPIFAGGDVVGFCTSGGYSHYADRSIAMGFLPTEMVRPDVEVEIEILGKRHPAKRIEIPLFDADGIRMRG